MSEETVRLPRLLQKALQSDLNTLKEKARLHPVSLSVEMNLSPLSRATMVLPESDPAVAVHDLVEIFGQNGSLGIFRVSNVATTYKQQRQVSLNHALDLFSDAIIAGESAISGTVSNVLGQIIASQTENIGGTPYWAIGTCADTNQYSIDNKYSNAMQCLTNLAKAEYDYYFTYDFSRFPWRLNFVHHNDTVLTEFRLPRNIANCQVTQNDSDLCTRLYLSVDTTTTTADGSTTTTTHEVHNDTAAQALYGIVCKTAGIKAEDVPDKAAWVNKYFERHNKPGIQISISGYEINKLSGDSFDLMHLGRICRVALPDYSESFNERIVSVKYPDILRNPMRVEVSLANKKEDSAGSFASLSSRASAAESKSSENSKEIQNNKTTSTSDYNRVVGRVETVEGDIETIEGTGVFQNSERITQVAGKFTVDSQGNVHVVNGSNLYLGESTASLAVYTDGNLTAGAIIQKINGTTKQDAILANKLEVGTTDVAAWGAYTDNTLTAGILVQKINNGTTLTKILGSKILVTADDTTEWGVYTDDSLTAGIIVDKINGGTVQINAAQIDLDGYVQVSAGAGVYGLLAADNIHAYDDLTVDGGVDAGDLSVNGLPFFQHTHAITGSVNQSTGSVTIRQGVVSDEDTSWTFNMADTTWYAGRVSAFKIAVSSALGSAAWDSTGGASTVISATLDTGSKVLRVNSAIANIQYPGDTGSPTAVSIGLGNLDLTSELNSYATAQKNAVTLSSPGWVNGTNVVSTNAPTAQTFTVQLPAFSSSGGTVWNSSHKTTVYFSTQSVLQPLMSVEVDASEVWQDGYTAGGGGQPTNVNVVKGTWSGGQITFRPSAGNGSTSSVQLSKGTETWNGNSCSFQILDGQGSTGYTCTVNAVSRYNAGWADAYAMRTIPGSNTSTDTITCQWPGSTPTDQTTRTYTLSATNTYISLKRSDSGSTTTVARIANTTYGAGQDSVNINKGSWSNGVCTFTKSAGSADTKGVRIRKDTTNSGWGTGSTANVYTLAFVDTYGGGSLSIGYTTTVSCQSKVTAAYNAGWAAAYACCSIVGNKIYGPPATVDGAAEVKATISAAGEITSIRNTAANYFNAQGWYVAKINDVNIDNGHQISKTQQINVGQ